jgi:hypothetical protein
MHFCINSSNENFCKLTKESQNLPEGEGINRCRGDLDLEMALSMVTVW